MKKSGKIIGIVFVLVIAFLSGILGGLVGFYVMETGLKVEVGGQSFEIQEREVYIEESEMIKAIESVQPAVVSIVASEDVFFGLTSQEISGGTGFIVTSDGLVVTNKHVVGDANLDYTAIMADGTQYPAEVVSIDPFEDIAVLRIIPGVTNPLLTFSVVKLGNSDGLKIGQKVMAIGYALAEYENTVTAGIISAKGRQIFAYDDVSESYSDFNGLLQTDAAINFGNSGGPLIDLEGRVVGMNSAIAQAGTGISFAIPVNDLKPILNSVLKYGEIIRPVFGVRFLMLTEQQAHEIDPSLHDGALLIGDGGLLNTAIVIGGSAESAGLMENDVILDINNIVVSEEKPLQTVVREFEPGDTVKVRFWRNGAIKETDVTLQSSKNL